MIFTLWFTLQMTVIYSTTCDRAQQMHILQHDAFNSNADASCSVAGERNA
jgi:hypothetical protein